VVGKLWITAAAVAVLAVARRASAYLAPRTA
jgi:hypothetical protein